jgi:hypothetical protein
VERAVPNRRLMIASAAALLAGPAFATGGACGSPLLTRAMTGMGGAARLGAVKALHWTGRARIFAQARTIEIGVSTTVRPFLGARSDTWLADEGPSRPRSLIIEGERGWTEYAGQRNDMPAAMLAHERQQYALYGLMLLAPLCGPGVETWLASSQDGSGRVEVSHPGAPRTTLIFGEDARLTGAENTVPSPDDGGADLAQVFTFSGQIEGGGVVWPRGLSIWQSGAPYFELTLETFEAQA